MKYSLLIIIVILLIFLGFHQNTLVQGLNEGIAEVQPTLEMVDAFMDSRGVEQ